MQFSGKNIVLTGAAGGLGRAFALGFAERGANVVVADMNEAGSAETVSLIESAGGKAIAVQTNVTDKASCEAVADAAVATFGSLDVLVNNAAIYATIERANFWEIDPNEWDKVMAVNVKGAWLASGAAYTRMSDGGSIINIASVQTALARPSIAPYTATKGAVGNLTKGMATDWAKHGLNCNAIAPGYIATPLTARNRYPMPFLMRAEDFAQSAVRSIERGDRYRVIPWPMGIVAKILKVLPDALFDRLLKGQPRKHRHKD